MKRILVSTPIVTVLVAGLAFAEQPARTHRTADGHPDLSGYWKGTRDTKPGGNMKV